MVRAVPTATPKKGAMQGVATTVAKTPEKKLPESPDFWVKEETAPVSLIPISKTPLKLRAKRNKMTAKAKTKTGSCN